MKREQKFVQVLLGVLDAKMFDLYFFASLFRTGPLCRNSQLL